jgi:hypothetical protein
VGTALAPPQGWHPASILDLEVNLQTHPLFPLVNPSGLSAGRERRLLISESVTGLRSSSSPSELWHGTGREIVKRSAGG